MHLSLQDRPSDEQGIRVIHAALDAGVTFIDTANVYCLDDHDIGHNERVVARALSSWARRGSVIGGTNGGLTRPSRRGEPDGRPAALRRSDRASLRALGVERIDLYQLHAPDPDVPFAESVGALAQLAHEGKIRWVGLSNVSVAQIRNAEAIVPIMTVQNRLNPFFREAIADGVVGYCGKQGIGFLAYSPTGGGRLNRKLPEHPILRAMSRELGFSPHALVLVWVLAQGSTVIAIPSARKVEHAVDSAGAADIRLGPEELRRIDEAAFSKA